MTTVKKWFFVTRPWSFVVSAAPVLITAVFLLWKNGTTDFNWINALLALIGIIIFHAAGNVLSDYLDYKTGVDNPEAFCIPNLVSGEYKAKDYLKYAIILFLAGILIGLFLTWRSDWRLLVIGGLGALLTLLYSRSKFFALADLNVFLIFGVLPMLGTSLVSTGNLDYATLWLSVPIGFITVAVLHSNNTRDISSDTKAGAKSFASVIGEKASMYLYIFYIWTPFIYSLLLMCFGVFPWFALVLLSATPMAKSLTQQALKYKTEGLSAFNTMDRETAKLQLIFSLLFVCEFLIDILWQAIKTYSTYI